MSDPIRYDKFNCINPDGQYVRFEEYEKLVLKLDSVHRENAELWVENKRLNGSLTTGITEEDYDELLSRLDTAQLNTEKAHMAHAKTSSELSAEKGENNRLLTRLDSIGKIIGECPPGHYPMDALERIERVVESQEPNEDQNFHGYTD